MEIPFVNLQRQYKAILPEINTAIKCVLKKQFFILGKELLIFEQAFARYLGSKYVVGVDNGSDGLILALMAAGIGKGDEVITPVNSFISTTFAISAVGARPILVDIDPATHQIDINQVKKKITKRTKALLPVHLYGAPCEIDKLAELTQTHHLFLVEDACQAHGSEFNNKKLGTFGIMGVFSFYPGKNLGAYGNGGAICTDDKKIYERLIKLRNFGQSQKYYHDLIGQNSKLDDLQAVILKIKLKYLDHWNKKRQKWALMYTDKLKEFKMPQIVQKGKTNNHLFIIECEKRDELQRYLIECGIRAQIHYPIPIHLQKCYQFLGYRKGDFPVAERIVTKILSLPIYADLTRREVEYIIKTVNNFKKFL